MSAINPPYRVKRDPPTVADVIVTAASPLLIMGVVGSLVFFLAEVFYAGKYEGRLLYTLFFFVVGAVLVGRIAVQADRSRAWAYGGVLAIVTVFALRAWVEYPPDNPLSLFKDVINIGLVAVVWWASNRLVWDCTHIDEDKTGSGQGLLAAAGWEKRPNVRPDVVDDAAEDESKYPPGMAGWYTRFDQWRKARDKKPHTPGLTVVYFAIAAIPMFGLGQAVVPSDDSARRNFTFWTMAIYVTSTLGLLLTTSFLGLRRYLRQRKLKMPMAMTASWMGLGTVLILMFVLIGALIPRPYSETPIWNPTRVVTGDKKASQYAQVKSGGAKGEGSTGDQATKGDGKATGKGGEPGGKGKSGESKSGSGDKQGKDGSSGGDKQGDKSGDQDGNKSKDGKDGKDGNESKDSGKQANAKDADGKDGSSKSGDSSPPSSASKSLATIANVLKWIVFAAVALLVVFVIFRHGLSFLANFMPWAKNLLAALDAWWKGLFGMREPGEKTSRGESGPTVIPRTPFSVFSNPFADGSADGRSVEALARYSFEALEAWAGDRARERRADETAIEFARRLGEDFPNLADNAAQLAGLVARMLYATDGLPKTSRKVLEAFWECLIHDAEVEVVAD
ncbi:DUF4129 domain-containing protein [Zavarzinella formosa]|uniref:DUF4129 domain-containing protein n=1 Tax=Zavarzinella formosa TaxID=360055 RepID=UPI00030E76D3|nr:DUF4129 domain-containing protein [Zavarzinella formosa]